MRAGETVNITINVALDGEDLDDYQTKSVVAYYNNGISNKILAIFKDSSITTTAPGPPLGATWEYYSLTVDNTPFTEDLVAYVGKLTFTIPSSVTQILQACKVRKPEILVEVILESTDNTIKEEYNLQDYYDSVSAGII